MSQTIHVQLTKWCEAMRGPDVTQEKLFSICQTADFVPKADWRFYGNRMSI